MAWWFCVAAWSVGERKKQVSKKIFDVVAAGLITAAIVGCYAKLDALAKGQAETLTRVVRIETIVMPPAKYEFSRK